MTEQKQPQAGEWWQKEDTRLCIVGTKKNGVTVGEMQSGALIPFMAIHDWQHLPDCDSFDWRPEVWPKWYVPRDRSLSAFVKKTSSVKADFTSQIGTIPNVPIHVDDHHWIEVTESEALARVKPVEVWPKYFVGKHWGPEDAYVRVDNDSYPSVWVIQSGKEKLHGDNYRQIVDGMKSWSWVEVTEDEALARVKPVEVYPQYWTTLFVASDVAYVVREEAGWYCVMKTGENNRKLMSGKFSSEGRTQITKEQASALLSPQESPDDWVEITDPEHVRRACDFVKGTTGHPDKWTPCVATVGYSQAAYPDSKIRCRRKDLPPLPSPDDRTDEYRILGDNERTVSTDERMYQRSQNSWSKITAMGGWETGMTVKELRTKFKSWHDVVVRRKDLPAVESPKRVAVRLWRSPGGLSVVAADDPPTMHWQEIKNDGNGFYFEVQS